MTRPAVGRPQIIWAYRQLYRHFLQAVQYSTPARYVIRDQIRIAFRRGDRAQYDPMAVQRTLEFLRNAARYNGIEHHVLKNILHVRWHQHAALRRIV